MKKRVLSVLLALALTVSLFAGSALATGLTVVTDQNNYTAGDPVAVTVTADSDRMIEVFRGDAATGNKVISSVTSNGAYNFKTGSGWTAGTYTVVVGAGSNTASCAFTLVASEEGGGTEAYQYTVKVTGPSGTLYPETEKSFSSGATALDALEATGLTYSASENYVSSISGVSEFDYGPGSGWMYRVYDSSGMIYSSAATTAANAFYLSDGDQVEWYYTCNYDTDGTYDSGMFSSNGMTALTAGSDGSAFVGADDLAGFVRAGNGLTVEADAGSVALTSEGASALAEKMGTGETLIVTITNTDAVKSGFSVVSNDKTIASLDISITMGATKITEDFGTMTILVHVGTSYANQTLSILHLKENGEYEILRGKVDTDGKLSFDTSSLSTFVVFKPKDVPVEYIFTDVKPDAWYADYVQYVTSNGIMTGTSATTFEPETAISRAMLVTVLYRMDGEPAVTGTSGFMDVTDAAAWYCSAVVWAASNGIVDGYGDGQFGPGDNVTRQQMVTIFYRYAQYKGYGTGAAADISGYSDGASVSDWAVRAFRWAVKNGIISGTNATTLLPSASGSRCEAAAVIMRFFESAKSPGADDAAATAYDKTAQYCLSSADPAYGSEWVLIGFFDGGYPVPDSWKNSYYHALCEYVAFCEGKLSTRKYTEYSRIILALTAAGYDPTDVAGYDLTAPLKDYDATVTQGLNGPVWALIALDRGSYSNDLRQEYVDYILSHELEGGGWALSGTVADPDMTAMALRALINDTDDPDVAEAVERGITALSKMQDEYGGYSTCGVANSESCAQVLWTLCKLGVSLDDARFVKNGNSVLDSLLSYQLADGSFEHTVGGGSNSIATEQAFCALASAVRLHK